MGLFTSDSGQLAVHYIAAFAFFRQFWLPVGQPRGMIRLKMNIIILPDAEMAIFHVTAEAENGKKAQELVTTTVDSVKLTPPPFGPIIVPALCDLIFRKEVKR